MAENKLSFWTGREKGLVVLSVILAIVAVVGIVLWRLAVVPSDAAAKVGDTYITESEVASSINQYRSSYSLTDNSSFASALASQGLNANTFRKQIIDEKATAMLVKARAKQLGLEPTSDEIDAQYNTMKSNMSFGSDEIWQQTIEQYGMSEDTLRDQILVGLEKQALYNAEVERQSASDSDTLSYAQSNLGGISQNHYYHMVFTGSDAQTRAKAAYDELTAMKEAGTLSAETFSQMARERSNEENVAQTGGSFAWAVEIADNEDYYEICDDLKQGELSYPTAIESNGGATEILYFDTTYTFPSSSSISSLTKADVPESLWEVIRSKASDSLWESSCEAYLSNLLMAGKVTYYPMPDNASYNIPITVTSASDSSSSAASSTAGSASSAASSGSSSVKSAS